MVDITHRVGIKAPAAKVYKALSSIDGLGHWWTEEVRGDTNVGGNIAFVFRKADGELRGQIDMKVRELVPSKQVVWRCSGEMDEWVDTDISFKLAEEDNQTTLMFAHRNWREESDFMSHCSTKWASFLFSLRDYVETGKGKPAPNDQRVDNWD
jgi:uncharacterized protein YndB with AHSA1/START domain